MTNKRIWRDLKCNICWNYTGFTTADLDQVMSKDYIKNYWCNYCEKYTNQDWTGPSYETLDGTKVELELNFEGGTNG
jgi:hypothetical protein